MSASSRKHNVIRLAIAGAIIAPLASLASPASATSVPSACTRYVAPGAPVGDGTTAASPMSLPNLVTYMNSASRPGLVACLAGGNYGSAASEFALTKGGSVGSPAVIVKNPASSTDVVVAGRIVIARGADNVMMSGLKLVGPGAGTASAYSIDANNVELINNDISAPNRICVSVGGGIRSVSATAPKVTGFVADGNRVHDCGTNLAKTGSPQAHGFYLEYSNGAIVRNNIISVAVGRGVQLFNDADNSLIENNIFHGNFAAVNFGGGTIGSAAVDPRPENNVVQNNIVTGGVKWCNTSNRCQTALFVQGFHAASEAPIPSTDPLTKAGATWGNVVKSNCVYLPDPSVAVTYNDWEPGFRYDASNTSIDPQYNNIATGDFRLKTTSPCLGKGLRPSIAAAGSTVTSTSITGSARLRSPLMTATYRLQARLCPTTVTTTTSTAACTGTWVTSAVASAVATDGKVGATVSGLLPGRIYETRWVTWQALQAAPASSVDVNATGQYWTASSAVKVATAL